MMLPMRRWVLALVLAAGCGPIAYVQNVTLGAQSAVDSAKAAQADKYSPYYWTRATQYLHMAREVAAHADFQGANKFGRLATEAAKLAEAEAIDPAKRPVNPMEAAPAKEGGIAPAKDPSVAPAKEAIAPAKEKAIAPAKEKAIAPAKDNAPSPNDKDIAPDKAKPAPSAPSTPSAPPKAAKDKAVAPANAKTAPPTKDPEIAPVKDKP
jgi:hypothetical protein